MRDIRICFIGDSFVNGTGDPTYLGWTGRVCAAMASSKCSLTHYNLGIRGNTSEQIEARWQAETALRFPHDCDRRLVFSFGTNDNRIENNQIFVEPHNSIACAERILTTAKAQCLTLLVGPPPIADPEANLRAMSTSNAYSQLCNKLAVPYLDTYTPLSKNAVWMKEVALVDGAHPAAGGYSALADLVLNWSAWQAWF